MLKPLIKPARDERHQTASNIDKAVGKRVRIARTEARMTQEMLAARLGLTFQQLQKYERGANRVSPGRLVLIARACNKPIVFFFADAEAPEDEGHADVLDLAAGNASAREILAASASMVRSGFVDQLRSLAGIAKQLAPGH